jgi:hypothetical protein
MRKQQHRLNSERREEQEVVARERHARRPELFRQNEQREQRRAEQACPALLEAKQKEFPKQPASRAARHIVFEPDADVVKPALGSGQHATGQMGGVLTAPYRGNCRKTGADVRGNRPGTSRVTAENGRKAV